MEEQYQQFMETLDEYSEKKESGQQEVIVKLLHETQEIFGYIPADAQGKIAEFMNVKPTTISVLIKMIPALKGEYYKHKIVVCSGPRCGAKGGGAILDTVEKELKVRPGQVTKDSKFLFSTQNCLKKCGVGPNMYVDDTLYSKLTPEMIKDIFSKY